MLAGMMTMTMVVVVTYIFVPRIMGEMRGRLTSRGLYGPLS